MDFNRVISSLGKKINVEMGHRPDMFLADVRKINNSTAQFLIDYSDSAPGTTDISDFFLSKFKAQISPLVTTARVYPKHKVITIVAQLLNLTREVADIKKPTMKAIIAGQSYLDVPMQDIWTVECREGQKVLVRKIKDDIMSIVEARRNQMMSTHTHKTFANIAVVNVDRYFNTLEPGDVVKVFMSDEGKLADMEIVKIKGEEATLKYENATLTLPASSIIEVKKSAYMDEIEKQALEKYYSSAYGDPSYAKELTK
jgi:hypothetical protein